MYLPEKGRRESITQKIDGFGQALNLNCYEIAQACSSCVPYLVVIRVSFGQKWKVKNSEFFFHLLETKE